MPQVFGASASFAVVVLVVLLAFGALIIIHELGHFLAARYFDVRVEAFSFGFGPRLFGFKRGETDYRVSPILIGGMFSPSSNRDFALTGIPPGSMAPVSVVCKAADAQAMSFPL